MRNDDQLNDLWSPWMIVGAGFSLLCFIGVTLILAFGIIHAAVTHPLQVVFGLGILGFVIAVSCVLGVPAAKLFEKYID